MRDAQFSIGGSWGPRLGRRLGHKMSLGGAQMVAGGMVRLSAACAPAVLILPFTTVII